MPKAPQLTPSKKGGIISLRKSANWSYGKLAKEFKRPVSTIKSIIEHYDRYGTVYNRCGDGRPPKLNEEAEERLVRSVKREPKRSAGFWGRRVDLSRQQTCRILKKHRLRYRMCRKKPFISAANALKRMKWAADNAGTNWKEVMFTDECCVKIGEVSGQQHCWRTGWQCTQSRDYAGPASRRQGHPHLGRDTVRKEAAPCASQARTGSTG
jgi:transposase